MEAGDIVGAYLRLVRPLGQGGMGAVWVAQHQRLGGEVAVKFLSTQFVHDAATRARFEQEARVSAQLRSPHVVQVMDFGLTQGEPVQPYIVMELLDGEDLGKRLERNGPIPAAEAELILTQLCEALGHAHRAGIVHRDIKPDNVFLLRGARPFVKLLDFGIALGAANLAVKRLTETGLIIGTAHYMSPEQLFSGKDVDLRTDLWAVGVLTYQMLTTRLPFHGETFGALCVNVQRGQFQAVGELASVPSGLNRWFQKALAIDREARFQSAEELLAGFKAAAAGLHDEVPDTVYAPQGLRLGTEAQAAMSRSLAGEASAQPELVLPRKSIAPLLAALVTVAAVIGGAIWWNSSPAADADEPLTTAAAAITSEPEATPAHVPAVKIAESPEPLKVEPAAASAVPAATQQPPVVANKPPQSAPPARRAPKPAPVAKQPVPKVANDPKAPPSPAKNKYRGF